MNLAEGEFIADIEEIDEGWWTGIGPGGKTGLFPSNYVEVVHQPETHEEEPAEVDTAPPPPPPPPPPPVVSAVPPAPLALPRLHHLLLLMLGSMQLLFTNNEIPFNEGDIVTDRL